LKTLAMHFNICHINETDLVYYSLSQKCSKYIKEHYKYDADL